MPGTESIATPSIAPGSEVPEVVEVRINPAGDPLAQAMETLLPEQKDQLERAAIQQAAVMLQSLTEVAKSRGGEEAQGDIAQKEREGEDVQMEAQDKARESAEVQIHQTEAGNTETQPKEESDDNDRRVQGEVAPPLAKKEQEEMVKKGIFLVVATNMVGDIFVTQLPRNTTPRKSRRRFREREDSC